jgi:transposase
MDLASGLEPGKRFRCAGCGNLTRFDVLSTERVRRFWHVDLSGEGRAEEEDRLEVEVESVTCRWCGSNEQIEVVDAPGRSEAPAQG